MEKWVEIRRRVLNGEISKRAACSEYGIHWETLEKILTHTEPPGYRRTKPRTSKLEPFLPIIDEILKSDRQVHRKQRHTAIKIWQILQQEGFTGSYTIVKDAVRQIKQTSKEVFMPLSQKPGEAQVDFGHAVVKFNGLLKKVVFFVMSLVHSDAMFVMAFPRECTEAFLEAHVRAFDFFGFVPTRISYDNLRAMGVE